MCVNQEDAWESWNLYIDTSFLITYPEILSTKITNNQHQACILRGGKRGHAHTWMKS